MTHTFEANGRRWRTDAETHALMLEYGEAKNARMLTLVLAVGQTWGRIVAANEGEGGEGC